MRKYGQGKKKDVTESEITPQNDEDDADYSEDDSRKRSYNKRRLLKNARKAKAKATVKASVKRSVNKVSQ